MPPCVFSPGYASLCVIPQGVYMPGMPPWVGYMPGMPPWVGEREGVRVNVSYARFGREGVRVNVVVPTSMGPGPTFLYFPVSLLGSSSLMRDYQL